MAIWTELLHALGSVLRFFHDITVGLFGGYSWVAAIILLTVTVRLLLVPLAVKQFRSMQAMQAIRPQMKRIQQRYKTDRGMMRTDPEKYKSMREKQQQEMMALYKEHNVNPASSCLPLVAQMPIFIALYSVLRSPDVIPELVDAPFFGGSTLQAAANTAGPIAIAMLVAMGITTFVQQKQMMGRQGAMADDQQVQQQKMMMYVMPVFLVFLGFNLPIGILVYWVTTNLWQMGQQWLMLREVDHTAPAGGKGGAARRDTPKQQRGSKGDAKGSSGGSQKKTSKSPGSNSNRPSSKSKRNGDSSSSGDATGNGHRSGGPKNVSKKQGETEDKRR